MNLISWTGKERKNEKKGYKEKELNYVYIDKVIIECFIGSKWEKMYKKKRFARQVPSLILRPLKKMVNEPELEARRI